MQRDAPPVAFLVALCALPPLSIDLGLPALPPLGRALHVGTGAAGLTISLFMAGFATTPLVYGLLSDRWGRRRPLLAGLALYVAGGLLCMVAPSLPVLLLGRLLQGAGAGSGPTLAFAVARDLLTGAGLGKRLALFTTLLNAAPVVAPAIGTVCLAAAGWRGVFAVLAAGGVLLLATALARFSETRPSASVPRSVWHDAAFLVRQRAALGHCAAYGLSAGAMFAYVATSPMLLLDGFGVSTPTYAALFAVTGSAIMLGSFVSGRWLHRAMPGTVVRTGLACLLAGSSGGVLLLAGSTPPLAPVVACLALATFGYGLLAPAAAHAALDELHEVAGTASALLTSVQMLCMSGASLLASLLFARFGVCATPLVMGGFALAAGAAVLSVKTSALSGGTLS